ncbi:hypothetical protein V1L54_09330 [Streptomyces sp. TRM 70361]|uniref:hypothetical protein n=1 Tax=Streptomyces sp. TRM 70361 TaxID=3116553 RepID=UPI002E7C42FC|nr:hypothetical protein [Streptomyces sp. TRM 70361]MEE1939616.1 hypothetical protein [Streptomyces sp. TRM 70361]
MSDVSYTGERCGARVIREATGTGPVTLTVGGEVSAGASYSAEGPVTPGAFEGDPGSRRRSIPVSASHQVPSGKFGRLVVRSLYDVYRYRVSGDGARRVPGTAAIPVGYCYEEKAS